MKYYKTDTEYNCGIDLHARQMYICVMDREGNILVHKNIKGNDFNFFLNLVAPYIHDLTVVCECCFNWYWLADACCDAGIEFVLGHALYLKHIHGGKNKNDTEAKPKSQPNGLERMKGASTSIRKSSPICFGAT